MSIPEVFFRETIDLNRYSNAVSADFVRTYNDVILLAARKLNAINIRQAKAPEGVVIAPQTKKRLRAIIAQSKSSLDKWSKTTTKKMIKEIEGLAKVQAGFIEGELKKAVKSGNIPINSVAVSSKYAESFVTTDPTKVNIFTSKQFTEDDFKKFGSGKFELTARQGAMQTLPNGETVEKAFRGIATRQQEGLARTIRQGVFSGESTQQIASRMIGKLEFGQKGTVKQIAQAGGELTKLANHQIQTIVRTSVNQVQNQASQAVYAANSKVAPKYEYVATLDSRTSPICKRLDGRKFEYNKGPTPPQHFNCRSTTVPVVDYAGLKKQKGFEDLTPPPKGKVVTRPTGEGTGRVPQDTQYGDWLLGQDKKLKVKTLGNEQKVKYFERLAKKEGSGQKAIRKMVREDGSERSLKDLERLYGKPSDITIKIPKPKPVAKPKLTQVQKLDQDIAKAKAQLKETQAKLKRLEERDPLQPTIGQLQGVSPTGKVKAADVNKAFDLMDEMEGLAGENARKLRQFVEKKQVFCNWSNGREGNIRAGRQKYDYFLNNPLFKQSIQRSIKNSNVIGFTDTLRSVERALDTNDFRFVSFELKRSYTAGGKGRKLMNGMTTRGSNHIVLKAKGKQKAIKSVKQMQDDVKDAVNYAKNNQNNPNWDRSNYWSAHGKGRFDEGTSWLKTYVHEMGHQVHYTNNLNKLDSYDWIPSAYGTGNYKERFAETFVQYIFSPVELKKASPSAYKWIEETLDASLKVVEKWN